MVRLGREKVRGRGCDVDERDDAALAVCDVEQGEVIADDALHVDQHDVGMSATALGGQEGASIGRQSLIVHEEQLERSD